MSKWKNRLRVTVFDESSFSEIRVFRGTPRRWFTLAVLAVFGIVVLTLVVATQSQLRNQLVPGLVEDEAVVQELNETRALTDSLEALMNQQQCTVMALRHVLMGDSLALRFLTASTQPSSMDTSSLFVLDSVHMTPQASELALREAVEEEFRFSLQRRSKLESSYQTGFTFPPLVGGISDGIDMGVGHLGVDLVAPPGSAIQAVEDGTVVLSSYTVETGYTLVIQHRNDRVSTYKHCASLLKQDGDLVKGGEVVALLGNTGSLTNGPHLHFEWWVQGRPLDPSPWLGVDAEDADHS